MKNNRLLLLIILLNIVISACNLGISAPQNNAVATNAALTVESALTTEAATTISSEEANIPPSPIPGVAIDGTTAEPATSDGCEDYGSVKRWERNGIFYDKTEADKPLTPNQGFVMSWIIENTGQCIWTDQYLFIFESGEFITSTDTFPAIPQGQTIPPGGQIRLDIPMAAPSKFGAYETIFSLASPTGELPLSVGVITTVGNPTNASLSAPGDLHYTYDCSSGTVNIVLNWTDKAKDEAGYRIYRDDIPLASLPAGATTYADIVPNSGTYSYIVAAFNSGGEAQSKVKAETSNCQ